MSDKATLILHCGGREVTREQLDKVEAPPATASWHPVKHAVVIDTVSKALGDSGFVIRKARYGLARDDHRFFGTLDLASELVAGVTLAVGVRNSTDKSFPLGFCAGSRTLVCDNSAFSSELLVKRKHTVNGRVRFVEAIARAVGSLKQFQAQETERIKRLACRLVTNEVAESYMLRAFEAGIVSHLLLPAVLKEWRTPSHDAFRPRTGWSLFNAFTTALGPRAKSNPQRHAALTMRLGALLDPAPLALPEGPSHDTAA